MSSKELTSDSPSDLATLWTNAVKDYNAKTRLDLRLETVTTMEDVMKVTNGEMNKFGGFRRDDERKAKIAAAAVRSAFSRHIGDMQKVMACIQQVGEAAAAFPPAMPVGIVFAACGHVLKSFAAVSADYDKVEKFFAYSSRFFDRLSSIENKTRGGDAAFARCIVRVFSCMLSICGIAQAMTKERRFRHWLNALWDLEDKDLARAYATMQGAVEELGQAIGYTSYKEIASTHDEVGEANKKLDQIDSRLSDYRQELVNLNLSVTEWHEEEAAGFGEVHWHLELLEEKLASIDTKTTSLQDAILKAREKKNAPDQRGISKKQEDKSTVKQDRADRKLAAIKTIKRHFDGNPDRFPQWQLAATELKAQTRDINEAFLEGTANWLVNEEKAFQLWLAGENPLLWLRGPDGVGKTFLSYACVERLLSISKKETQKRVAYFYFKEDHPYLQSAHNSFACAVLQIANADSRYAVQVAADLEKMAKESKDASTWRRFFASRYPPPSVKEVHTEAQDDLFIVLDGLDEAPEQEIKILLQSLTDIKKENLKIHVLLTSRPEKTPLIELLKPLTVDITKEKISSGIKALIQDRLNSRTRLRKLTKRVQKTILRNLCSKADGMLYAEHMLLRLNHIGRKDSLREAISKSNMPGNLRDLYKLLLNECRGNRTKDQCKALKKLFAWLAFSKTPLSLAEASALVKMTISDDKFDIEDEVIGRSARILELSQSREVDDDANESGKDDDDDKNEEGDAELEDSEYQNVALTFKERSLRQYFRDFSGVTDEDELRTPALAAHLTIMEMSTHILVRRTKATEDDVAAELISYAARYWYDHLVGISIDEASVAEVKKVLEVLHQILANTNLAKPLEQYTYVQQLYPDKQDSGTTWLDRVMEWVKRGASLPEEGLSEGLKQWVSDLEDRPTAALLPLARGHVLNWFQGEQRRSIFESYCFAKAALEMSGHFQKNGDPQKEILSVAHFFDDLQIDWRAMRAIGTALMDLASQNSEIREAAISYLKKALDDMEDGSGADKFSVHLLLASVYGEIENSYQKGVEEIDHALAVLSSEELTNKKDERADALVQKAQFLTSFNKTEEALSAYNEARAVAGEEEPLSGWDLNGITLLQDDKDQHPAGSRLLETLRSWGEKERNQWCDYMFSYRPDLSAVERMSKAAKQNGDIGVKFVLDMLAKFQDTLNPSSLTAINLQVQLALFHSRVLGDDQKAKELSKAALKVKIPQQDPESIHERLSEVRMNLADLIFSEFRTSSDPNQKAALVEELKKNIPVTTDPDDFLRESHIGMLLANMLRIMGPAVEYQAHMEKVFGACIKGLTDNVGYNDFSSLRLLCKVLGSLDGLERDALIADSAQFSSLNPDLVDPESTLLSKVLGSLDRLERDALIADIAQFSSLNPDLVDPESTDNRNDNESSSEAADEASQSKPVTEPTEPTGEQKDVHNATEKVDFEKQVTDTRETEITPSASPLKGGPAEKENVDNATKQLADEHGEISAEESKRPESDEEFGSSVWMECDGGCGRSQTKWDEPFYLCLICPNLDLCTKCYAKRMAQNRGEPIDAWRSYCGKDHVYIKGPIEGWKGVKHGVIRIGDEEIGAKDWLKQLQDVKWKKAWDRFWLSQGGLKNVESAPKPERPSAPEEKPVAVGAAME